MAPHPSGDSTKHRNDNGQASESEAREHTASRGREVRFHTQRQIQVVTSCTVTLNSVWCLVSERGKTPCGILPGKVARTEYERRSKRISSIDEVL